MIIFIKRNKNFQKKENYVMRQNINFNLYIFDFMKIREIFYLLNQFHFTISHFIIKEFVQESKKTFHFQKENRF